MGHMMRTRWYVIGAMVVCLTGGVANPVGAGTTADTVKPTLLTPVFATPVLGSQVGTGYFDEERDELIVSAQLVASWDAEDASGICGIRRGYGNSTEGFPMSGWYADRVVARTISANYRTQYSPDGYRVQARDCAGNKRAAFISFNADLEQETVGSYIGNWGVSRCACWSGGTTKQTSQAGARVDFTVGRGLAANIGVVMETAPDRGKVQILVNGELRAVADTYSAVKVHRAVVWVGAMREGATLSIVNLATPGRARIDVDALVLPTFG
jgi:hypothetical protein